MLLWDCDMDYNTSSIIVKRFFFLKSLAEQMLTSRKWRCIKTPFIIMNEVYKLDLKNI